MEYNEEVKDYLDLLREDGSVNMYGARSYLQEEFGVDKLVAGKWLNHWMEEF